METLVAILLAGAVIAYIGYPLFRPRVEDEEQPEAEETKLAEVIAQKESMLAAIAELDFDRAMGNLSEKDYQELRDKYKLRTLALMKKQDELAQAEEPSRVVQQMPAGRTKEVCSSCGGKISAGDRFCASCGNPVGERCPNCGAEYGSDDVFCANCGQRLAGTGRRR